MNFSGVFFRSKPVLTGLLQVGLTTICFAQSISGYVRDENNDPIPYANIFVTEITTGAAADDKGHYFLTIEPGFYNLVISSVGFESKTLQIVVADKPLIKNIILTSSSVELNEVVVRSNRRDPAYEIIQKAIDHKDEYLSQFESFRTNVYVRALEVMDKKLKEKDREEEELTTDGPPVDPLEAARKEEEARLQKINLLEMQVLLSYRFPGQYKEEQTAYKSYGDMSGLFIPLFSQTDFNFYRNLVDLKGISEVPVISPLSRTAILSYKYKLEETTKEGDLVVYKIRFTPRKSGDATGKGTIYINDSTWNINRVELSLHKGALKFYDDFTISQKYEEIDNQFWIPARQQFDYETKSGAKTFTGNTVLVYSDFQRDYVFPPRFFGNEVSVITKEAYERDSSYWNRSRPEPLDEEQRKVVTYRDSVEAAHKTKAYLDSMQAKYNKVTVGDVLYGDIGIRSEEKKSNISFSSLLSTVGFEVVGGWRLGPRISYFRRYESGRSLWTVGFLSVGLKNTDWQGNYNIWFRYNPYKLGDVALSFGKSFYSINSFDAYLNQLRISNYIVHNYVHGYHRIELFNGFYVDTDLDFSDRRSIAGYDATSIINQVLDPGDPLIFQPYQAFITKLKLSYTPGQKYMTEPNRKVVLGSKYPTFGIAHQKGWNGLFSSDIDFDYVEFSIEQNLLLGTLGNSRYTISAGKFVNTKNLDYIDLKRFRQSDPYLYSDPLHSFQLLDTALATTNVFVEGHYIHHFNGAMINNIPLVKKLRIQTVGGAGFMWVQESGYRYEELFGGLERIFKLNARRRLRIGVYGVVAQSNMTAPVSNWKISFDIIDTWKRDWSF